MNQDSLSSEQHETHIMKPNPILLCSLKKQIHNASNELLGELLASKLSEQQTDTLI